MTRIIIWEKWRDPFGGDDDHEWPGAFGTFKTDKIINEQTFGTYLEDDEEEDDDEDDYEGDSMLENFEYSPGDIQEAVKEHHRQQTNKKVPMIQTHMGLIPMTEHTRAGNIFNFWTAHTNFRMTKDIKDVIDLADGVETLDIFTPYRWRISVGKAFDSGWVKKNLMRMLQASSPKNPKKKSNDNKKNGI